MGHFHIRLLHIPFKEQEGNSPSLVQSRGPEPLPERSQWAFWFCTDRMTSQLTLQARTLLREKQGTPVMSQDPGMTGDLRSPSAE